MKHWVLSIHCWSSFDKEFSPICSSRKYIYSPLSSVPDKSGVQGQKRDKISYMTRGVNRKLLIKMSLHAKLSFLHMLFLENEANNYQSNYRTMRFMSKQVSLWKISSILKKNENRPKTDIRPFCPKVFNFIMHHTNRIYPIRLFPK